jgi:putative ABC transport system substrate-binding protein
MKCPRCQRENSTGAALVAERRRPSGTGLPELRGAEPGEKGSMVKPRAAGIVLLILAFLTTTIAAEAQQAGKTVRVGILGVGRSPSPQELAKSVAANPFWLSMKRLGWVEGRNMIVERRFGESTEQLRRGAAELVRLKVDVLFVRTEGLAKLLQQETKTIPIVIGTAGGDLVALGLVASLAKPGGNITGAQVLGEDLVPKRLELLKTLVPHLSRVAILWDDVTTAMLPETLVRYDQQAVATARTLGIAIHTVVVHRADGLPAAFLDMMSNQDHGLLVRLSTFMFDHRRTIADLAKAHRIPAIYELEVFVEAGGLMSYGVNVPEMEARAATYVDKILRGARPADLPIEQPTRVDLAINRKTARAMGLSIPPSLLLRADQVIE